MSRYVAKVDYEYGMVDGKLVPVSKTVRCHDRFGKLFDTLSTLRHLFIDALPVVIMVGAFAAVTAVICYQAWVW